MQADNAKIRKIQGSGSLIQESSTCCSDKSGDGSRIHLNVLGKQEIVTLTELVIYFDTVCSITAPMKHVKVT